MSELVNPRKTRANQGGTFAPKHEHINTHEREKHYAIQGRHTSGGIITFPPGDGPATFIPSRRSRSSTYQCLWKSCPAMPRATSVFRLWSSTKSIISRSVRDSLIRAAIAAILLFPLLQHGRPHGRGHVGKIGGLGNKDGYNLMLPGSPQLSLLRTKNIYVAKGRKIQALLFHVLGRVLVVRAPTPESIDCIPLNCQPIPVRRLVSTGAFQLLQVRKTGLLSDLVANVTVLYAAHCEASLMGTGGDVVEGRFRTLRSASSLPVFRERCSRAATQIQ